MSRRPLMAALGAALALASGLAGRASAQDEPARPADAGGDGPARATASAVFGGGCFWCLEAFFERLPGVKDVVSGYAGGNSSRRPTYAAVSSGATGHAEVVRIEFDPAVLTYEQLLEVFWACHDPTTLNRQGPDAGTQYRSIILYADEAQRRAAERSYQELSAAGAFGQPIVTQLVPLTAFYPAESYHQNYYRKKPNDAYCRMVITPKLRELQQKLQKVAAQGPKK